MQNEPGETAHSYALGHSRWLCMKCTQAAFNSWYLRASPAQARDLSWT